MLTYPTPPENPPFLEPVKQVESTERQANRAVVDAALNCEAEHLTEGGSARLVDQPSDFVAAPAQRGPLPSLDTSVDSRFSSELEPSVAEAADLLSRFKTLFIQHFPFVVVPVDKSSQELQQEKPYLYKSIMMVASYHQPVRQLAMGEEIVQGFSTSLLIRVEKSLDLLQGLLVYSAWFVESSQMPNTDINIQHTSCISCWIIPLTASTYARHYYHFSVNPRLTNVLQLTLGLMFDLGLKTSRSDKEEEVFSYAGNNADEHTAKKEVNMADEQRAYLGCFVLSSV
jgi:hypothetical protein